MARKIDRLGGKIKHFKEPLRQAVRKVVIPSIQTNFHKSGRPRWEDLAESTWAQKRPGSKILIETGALMHTMGLMKIWRITNDTAMITDLPQSVWYGKLHQEGRGGTRGFGIRNVLTGRIDVTGTESEGLPARPFVMLQEEDMPKIDEVFREWLGQQVREVGL
jgi:phage gpG-like protein